MAQAMGTGFPKRRFFVRLHSFRVRRKRFGAGHIGKCWTTSQEFAEGTAIQSAKSLLQLFEGIEDLKSGASEVPIVACHNR